MVRSIIVEHLGSQTKEFGDNLFWVWEWYDEHIYLEIPSCDTELERLEKENPEATEIVIKLFYILSMDQ